MLKPDLTREEIAKNEIGRTEISPKLAYLIVCFFLVVIFLYPLLQMGYEITFKELKTPQALDLFLNWERVRELPTDTPLGELTSFNRELNHHLKSYETQLENNSLLREELLSPIQSILSRQLKTGNEKVVMGEDGWLYYLSDMDYPMASGFMNQEFQRLRYQAADVQPDPLLAILEFKKRLATRGIQLILMPVPVKPVIYPEKLSSRLSQFSHPLQNESYARWKKSLESQGVIVFDPAPVLMDAKKKGIQTFLKTDTHWTPEGMDLVAKELSRVIQDRIPVKTQLSSFSRQILSSQTNLGDIALMLNLKPDDQYFQPETVQLRQVKVNGRLLRPSSQSEVLFLGDSFSNIYSLKPMGWGEGAGLVENLSYYLKAPVDAIVRNDAGSYATREILAQELAKGHDRLEGKKVVVWEFASRELVSGNWKLIDIPVSKARNPVIDIKITSADSAETANRVSVKETATPVKTGGFFVPEEGESYHVTARVKSVSAVPQPGTVPYKDHVMAIHLIDIKGPGIKMINAQAMVYLMSMRDQKLTSAASLRTGQLIHINLNNWSSVEDEYGGFNRSELDDPDISLQDPCWGELTK